MRHIDTGHEEDVWECRSCSSHWPEEVIAVEEVSKARYCRTCNSRDLRLSREEGEG